MKTPLSLSAWLLLLFSSFNLGAQTFQLRNNRINSYSYLHFLGKDDRYYYYETGSHKVTRFTIGNIVQAKEIELKYDEPKHKEGISMDIYLYGGHFTLITRESPDVGKTEMEDNIIKMYRYDMEGALLKKTGFERRDSSSKYYSSTFDTSSRRIYLKRSGTVIASYDFELEETEDDEIPPGRAKPRLMGSFAFDFSSLLSQLGMKNITINVEGFDMDPKKIHTDSTSLDNYRISYSRKKDDDIFRIRNTVEEISISTQKGEKKEVEFSTDDDREIFDLSYRETTEGNLLLFGKYIIKGRSKSSYGMFSAVFDKSLNTVSKTKYFELNSYYKIEGSVPNEKYIGFVFDYLHDYDYEFHLEEEDIFVFTYQHSYTNLQDHIYMLKIESNGEITVNRIVNRLDQKTKSGVNEKHMALRAGNRIHIIFYDHIYNMGKEVSDLDYKNGDIDKKKTCVLAYTTYDVLEDQYSKKTQISDRKTLKILPRLLNPVIHFDTGLNQYVTLLRGLNKDRKTIAFYELIYVD